MKRVFTTMLLCAAFLTLQVSCEKESLKPFEEAVFELPDELAQMKAELDEEILSVIRSTNKPFDWGTASNEMIMRAILVTGFPLVIGYVSGAEDGRVVHNELLDFIYASEGVEARRDAASGETDDVLQYKDDRLNFMHVKISKGETLEGLRTMRGVRYVEPAGYPILMDEMLDFISSQRQQQAQPPSAARDMVLDPFQESPDYFSQVQAYSGSISTCMRNHNVDHVYRDYQIYGEGVGIAVLDNGVLPEQQAFMLANGYGERIFTGHYNPLWFIPGTEPDGASPQTPDVLFLSQFIDGQWLHGWQSNEDVLVAAPNAKQVSVRASPLVLLLFPAQNLGVVNGLLAMADDPDVRIASMALGSLFRVRPMEDAIDYFHSKDKILVSAAGTSFFFIRELIGVVFPASYEPVLAVTGIKPRNETDGNFVLGDNAHGGSEVDFSIEPNGSSSGAVSRFAGMLGLVWSANPELTREEVIDIVISSSNFYQELGHKYARFGWGLPDIQYSVEAALTGRY